MCFLHASMSHASCGSCSWLRKKADAIFNRSSAVLLPAVLSDGKLTVVDLQGNHVLDSLQQPCPCPAGGVAGAWHLYDRQHQALMYEYVCH